MNNLNNNFLELDSFDLDIINGGAIGGAIIGAAIGAAIGVVAGDKEGAAACWIAGAAVGAATPF